MKTETVNKWLQEKGIKISFNTITKSINFDIPNYNPMYFIETSCITKIKDMGIVDNLKISKKNITEIAHNNPIHTL